MQINEYLSPSSHLNIRSYKYIHSCPYQSLFLSSSIFKFFYQLWRCAARPPIQYSFALLSHSLFILNIKLHNLLAYSWGHFVNRKGISTHSLKNPSLPSSNIKVILCRRFPKKTCFSVTFTHYPVPETILKISKWQLNPTYICFLH